LQRTVNDHHAAMGHYGYLAAFSFTAVGLGLLASAKPTGWRIRAWVAGVLPALLGIASLLPGVEPRLAPVWAVAAIAWGIAFVGAAKMTRGRETQLPLTESVPTLSTGSAG
jgi:hypothetical protein